MVLVRPLDKRELERAAALLARGMRDNPLHVRAFGDQAERRATMLERMFRLALPALRRKGAILGAFDGETLLGAAGMVPPGRCQPTPRELLALVPRMLPAIGAASLSRVGRWMGEWQAHDLDEPHWHLGPVAVDAHLQRQGIGRALLDEFCGRVDHDGAAAYLETDKAANVRFYERFGFETIEEQPVLDAPNWFMKRERRP